MSACPLCEDEQNQLGARHHAALELFFDVALLRRREIVIKYHQVSLVRQQRGAQFIEFAFTDEQARVGALASCSEHVEPLDVGGSHQILELHDFQFFSAL